MKHWEFHPHVRTGSRLSVGERAADILKHWFGTWTALGTTGVIISLWITAQATGEGWDPYPYILLNLCLSCLAAVQGIILQISANRGDRIASEVAKGTYEHTSELLTINRQQLDILTELREIRQKLEG